MLHIVPLLLSCISYTFLFALQEIIFQDGGHHSDGVMVSPEMYAWLNLFNRVTVDNFYFLILSATTQTTRKHQLLHTVCYLVISRRC